MNSRALAFTAAVAAGLLLGAVGSARAELVRIDFTGANSTPGAANVWGTPVPALTGYVIYDSSAPGTFFSSTATNYFNAVREVNFAIGDVGPAVLSGSKSGNVGYVQVSNAAGADRISFNNMILVPPELLGEVPTVVNGTAARTFNDAQLTLSLQGPNTALASQDLPGVFDPSLGRAASYSFGATVRSHATRAPRSSSLRPAYQ